MALRELATKATGTLSDMPRADSPNVCRMEDIILKIVDSENEINAEIDRLVDLKREMRVVIGAVEQSEHQTRGTPFPSEWSVRGRILALVAYLETLQRP